jgi:hypothetical protein
MSYSQIHHYTSVETLALILESKKIRFNRTDKVDDLTEGRRHPTIQFGKYFFVSCWTYDLYESIPQWHMYTDRMTGVRISLPIMPFQEKRLIPPATWKVESSGSLYGPLSLEEQWGRGYFVVPGFMDMKSFGAEVEYSDDIEARYERAITLRCDNGQLEGHIREPFDLVRLKTRDWAFQKEYRFALFILPSISLPKDGPGDPEFVQAMPSYVANALNDGTGPPIDFIDIDLSETALRQIKITTGPLSSKGSKLAVEALVNRYAPGAIISESIFTGNIRAR